MEIENKKKTYNKRRKSNKRNRKVARHRNGNNGVMTRRQLREFFGHRFGATEINGFIAPLVNCDTPSGELAISFIADKNDNICGVNECFAILANDDRVPLFDKEEIAAAMNIYRGQNLLLVIEEGGYA